MTSLCVATIPYAQNHTSLSTATLLMDLTLYNRLTVQIIGTLEGVIGGVPHTPPDLSAKFQIKNFILVFETLEHVELSVELECTTKCVQVKLMV